MMAKKCIICYGVSTFRTTTNRNINDERSSLMRFLQLLERYLDERQKSLSESRLRSTGFPEPQLEQLVNSGVGSCEGCSEDLESFMELYHQMKSVQLLINWRLKKITDIMIDVEAKPSRKEEFLKLDNQKLLGSGNGDNRRVDKLMRGILDYRKQLINKCTQLHQNDFPKLILTKCQLEMGSQTYTNPLQIKTEKYSSDSDMETDAPAPSVIRGDGSNAIDSDCDDDIPSHNYADPTFQHIEVSDVNNSVKRDIKGEDNNGDVETENNGSTPGSAISLNRLGSDHVMHKTPTFFNESSATAIRTIPVLPGDGDNPADSDCENASACVKRLRSDRNMHKTTSSGYDDIDKHSADESSGTDSDSEYYNDDETDDSSGSEQDNANRGRTKNNRANPRTPADNRNKLVIPKKRNNSHEPTKQSKNSVTTSVESASPSWSQTRKSATYQAKLKATMGLKNSKCKIPDCPKSSTLFCIPSDFEAHQKLHGLFTCSFCGETYDYAPNLVLHELMEHSNIKLGKEQAASKCPRPDCSKKYNKREDMEELLTQHILSVHLKVVPETLSHQCPVCDVVLKTDLGLGGILKRRIISHYDLHHNTDNMEDGAKIHKCDQPNCHAYFKTWLQLTVHKLKNHGLQKERYECTDCKKLFMRRRYLNDHRRVHHLKENDLGHRCNFDGCFSRFETDRELKCHIAFGHKGKGATPVSCKICGKTVKGKAGLISHMTIHGPKDANDKRYVCDICGRGFQHGTYLKQHQLSNHFRDKWTFNCSICPKKCMNQQRLNVHMRMHTQEKPFVCDICGLKYAHRHNLKIHVNSSHKNKNEEKV